jgi:hypothetical protein
LPDKSFRIHLSVKPIRPEIVQQRTNELPSDLVSYGTSVSR